MGRDLHWLPTVPPRRVADGIRSHAGSEVASYRAAAQEGRFEAAGGAVDSDHVGVGAGGVGVDGGVRDVVARRLRRGHVPGAGGGGAAVVLGGEGSGSGVGVAGSGGGRELCGRGGL